MTALVLIAGAAGVWLGGYALSAALCDPSEGRAGRLERIGLSLPLGIAANSGAMFAWSLAGGTLSSALSWTLTCAGGAAGLLVLILERRRCGSAAAPRPKEPAPRGAALAGCCASGAALLLVGTCVLALMTTQRFWDERAIFGIKAKVLATDGSVLSPHLRDPDFVQGHPRYPLLIPLAETHVYMLLGRIEDRWPKGLFPLLFAGLTWTYAGVLSRRLGAGPGWLFALLLAVQPVLAPFELGFITAQGDAPVACYHGLTALYAWDWLRQRGGGIRPGRRGVLIGVLAAAAAFTKDEGLAHLVVGALALALAGTWSWCRERSAPGNARIAAVSRSRLVRLLGIAGATAVVLLAPWLMHRQTLPTTNEMQYVARLNLARLTEQGAAAGWVVPHVAARMFHEWSTWGLQWWLLAAAAITMPRRVLRPAQVFLLLEIAGSLAAFVVAGMIAPAELHDHIGGSSHRYLMQLTPLAVLFVAGQWGGVDESGEPKAESGGTGMSN